MPWSRTDLDMSPRSVLTRKMTLGNLLNLSDHSLSHLSNGDNNPYFLNYY